MFDNGVNLATEQLTGPWQNIIHNCHNHLSFSLSPNQQNSGQEFFPLTCLSSLQISTLCWSQKAAEPVPQEHKSGDFMLFYATLMLKACMSYCKAILRNLHTGKMIWNHIYSVICNKAVLIISINTIFQIRISTDLLIQPYLLCSNCNNVNQTS